MRSKIQRYRCVLYNKQIFKEMCPNPIFQHPGLGNSLSYIFVLISQCTSSPSVTHIGFRFDGSDRQHVQHICVYKHVPPNCLHFYTGSGGVSCVSCFDSVWPPTLVHRRSKAAMVTTLPSSRNRSPNHFDSKHRTVLRYFPN